MSWRKLHGSGGSYSNNVSTRGYELNDIEDNEREEADSIHRQYNHPPDEIIEEDCGLKEQSDQLVNKADDTTIDGEKIKRIA